MIEKTKKKIVCEPNKVSLYYRKLWNELNIDDDKQQKKILNKLFENQIIALFMKV